MIAKFLAYIFFLLGLAVAAAWYSQQPGEVWPVAPQQVPLTENAWLDHLYSGNPREAEQATGEVTRLGERALPAIGAVLRDPSAHRDRRKAALKAASILGPSAAPLVHEIAAQLPDPELTAEAALALSFVGREAFAPLADALKDDDPAVRREALRSIGKLRSRAPLEPRVVLPLLIKGLRDPDASVRAVAATYLGISQDDPSRSVPALMAGLRDPDVEVRLASATALGSFGDAAKPAIPALRKAAGDPNVDVAREAGRALIELQPGRR